jgi:hypothetical protein
VPPDYQGYYARDQRLASGPHPGEPTPQQVREEGTKFCVGTPADCIRFLEIYEARGIEEAILLCAVGPAQHEEVSALPGQGTACSGVFPRRRQSDFGDLIGPVPKARRYRRYADPDAVARMVVRTHRKLRFAGDSPQEES